MADRNKEVYSETTHVHFSEDKPIMYDYFVSFVEIDCGNTKYCTGVIPIKEINNVDGVSDLTNRIKSFVENKNIAILNFIKLGETKEVK